MSYRPAMHFSAGSRLDLPNPFDFIPLSERVSFNPKHYSAVFLAGLDWEFYIRSHRPKCQPVINLIQHVRHADPAECLFQFLSQPAIRICVSSEVERAICATGRVNGPVFTVPNGVEAPSLILPRVYDLVILGIKEPEMAQELAYFAESYGLKVALITKLVARECWYNLAASSRIAITLPHKTEGFYIPALEAMHFCDLVIVPDCIGNREFCSAGVNCLMPNYRVEDIEQSLLDALALPRCKLSQFKDEAKKTVSLHSIANERRAFLSIMDTIDTLWHSID